MKVKLDSSWEDIYDQFFDTDGDLIFRRHGQSLDCISMFKMLNMIGFKTPKFGMVAELYKDLGGRNGGVAALKKSEYGKLVEMVVHTNTNSTIPNGKIKMSLDEARENYPGHFAVQFIPTSKSFASRTERLLVIGGHQVWSEYTSNDDWRSTCGDTHISRLSTYGQTDRRNNIINEIKAPLFAIDFVCVGHERLAIHFDAAPYVKGTPAAHMFTPKEIANAIKDRIGDLNAIQRYV